MFLLVLFAGIGISEDGLSLITFEALAIIFSIVVIASLVTLWFTGRVFQLIDGLRRRRH